MRVFVNSFRLPKGGNQENEYEDAFFPRLTEEEEEEEKIGKQFRFAIADGASAGILSGEWARVLTEVACDFLVPVDARNILETGIDKWKGWRNDYLRTRDEQHKPIKWYEESGLSAGAFATILVLELNEEQSNKWRAVAIGDSCLFQVREGQLVTRFPIKQSNEFNNNPALLCSISAHNDDLEKKIEKSNGEWQMEDEFYLMTDAIAQWFLTEYEAGQEQWNNPMCFLFLIDQSGSMNDSWSGGTSKKKADGLADIINRLLQELVLRCAKAEGMRDYFHVGVIAYGAQVGPAFRGGLAGQDLVPISQVGEMPANIEERTKKVDDGAGGLIEQKVRFPVWFTPVANGGTPMRQAFSMAVETARKFLAQHPDCFPPIVLHLTDGESTDGDPSDLMRELMSLNSSDGNTLLFNYHISSSGGNQIAFPHSLEQLPNDPYARMLFDNASELTEFMRDVARREHNLDLPVGAKGYVFNADSVLVIQALDIGTRVSNLR